MDKLNPDRLFPADPTTRAIARNLYQLVKDLPIISRTAIPIQNGSRTTARLPILPAFC
jgi:hypothetical protein